MQLNGIWDKYKSFCPYSYIKPDYFKFALVQLNTLFSSLGQKALKL